MERARQELTESVGRASVARPALSGQAVRAAVLAVLRRPRLWPVAVVQVFVLARRGWWRRWPPLPVPDAAYLRFRMQTMYGGDDHEPEAADVVTYLEWCSRSRGAVG